MDAIFPLTPKHPSSTHYPNCVLFVLYWVFFLSFEYVRWISIVRGDIKLVVECDFLYQLNGIRIRSQKSVFSYIFLFISYILQGFEGWCHQCATPVPTVVQVLVSSYWKRFLVLVLVSSYWRRVCGVHTVLSEQEMHSDFPSSFVLLLLK